ncbi:hypothetical protein WT56_03360 [Burkholderia pseudomultivorans]|uniref:Uncharacterized protein n=1 Tax=Burkholderia pseudomultivorans TaxID=1207504 RepID=A0A132EMK9_9BURK|nr:hypothetical protein WT56_03360 [Burkholderia pseudomultivorans]
MDAHCATDATDPGLTPMVSRLAAADKAVRPAAPPTQLGGRNALRVVCEPRWTDDLRRDTILFARPHTASSALRANHATP